ncbi:MULTISPECIES: low molecular weight protein-tyrosine-phosphatase [unclassified Streptomyces]|uniref:low molecular weight protein-tyrosine-phosphatase n=1 Tax=unclassified Streptomyces TaxID=2593676 RepID=UPI0021C65E6D|nr:low molecular weight protein-tyrosine-phosphatase [Streptomyces sp. FIT100]UUN29944.1 low molecular weight phosphotyrosine protein phosphatase [Streptomyces sp. FIT100]
MRILTVCLGNICRSPYAASVLAYHGGATVEVRSAGLRDKWAGMPAHERMLELAAARGFDLTAHRAMRVTLELVGWADVVLAMDRAVLTELGGQADDTTIHKFALYLGDRDVPDPYGGDSAAFTACADVIEAAVNQHLP